MSGELALNADELEAAGFRPLTIERGVPPYYSFRFGDRYELALEPLTFRRWSLALYKGQHLLLPAKLELPPRRAGDVAFYLPFEQT